MHEADEEGNVRLLDLEGVIERRLGALPYQDYLCAIYAIAETIAEIYSEFYPAGVRDLAGRTVAVAKTALRDGEEAGAAAAAAAAGLADEWTAALKAKDTVDGPPGAGTALVMFAALSDEISMAGRRKGALPFVTASVVTYPGKPYIPPVKSCRNRATRRSPQGTPAKF